MDVIYCQHHNTRSEAKKRELELKTGKGREWIWNKIRSDVLVQGFISA